MHTIMGIDPGRKGGIVCLSQKEGKVLLAKPMPNEPGEFARLVNEVLSWGYAGGLCVVLEQAGAFAPAGRKQGAHGMFGYGRGFGRLEGILEAFNVKSHLVTPAVWTKAMTARFKPQSDDTKARALLAVKELFPGLELIQPRCRKPHEGIIDALLIAEYWRSFGA